MRVTVASALVFYCLAGGAFSREFFLATTGSDTNPGTIALPFKTLQKAADALGPGDTLYIRGGTYTFSEPTTFWNSGTAEAPIRVMNYASEVVILRAPWFRLIETQASYISFESSGGSYNLKLADSSCGISVATVSSHIKISGLEIYGMRQDPVLLEGANGIFLMAVSDMEVRGCYIHDNGNDWHEHGIYMRGGSGIVIAGNIIAHNAGWGVHGYGPTDGGDGPVIEKNFIYGNGSNYNGTAYGSGIIISESWRNAVVRNNFYYNNKVHGIQVESWDEGGTPPTNTLIVNNTLFNNGDAELRVANANGTKVYNNIIYDGSGGLMISAAVALADLASDYNLFHLIGAGSFDDNGDLLSFAEWKVRRNVDANSITADPLFVNLSVSNAHLLANSPAVDRGSPNFAPIDDIDGEPRPQGSGVEIGADEWTAQSSGAGKADAAIVDANTGDWYFWLSSQGYARSAPYHLGVSGGAPVAADFDGDGKADPAIVSASGTWFFWLSSQSYVKSGPYPLGVSGTPVAGDFDNDGKDDPAMVNSAGWYLWLSGQSYAQSGPYALGMSGVPIAANFDGDGKGDAAVVSASGNWYLWLSGQGYAQSDPIPLGVSGTPVAADFDGDGKDDPAMVSSTGNWYFWLSSQGWVRSGPYSLDVTGMPAAGDFDGQ